MIAASGEPLEVAGKTAGLANIQPEAREIAQQVASVYIHHLGPDLVSLVIHGSGMKGGLIEGSSDLDFAAFVRPECVSSGGELPLDRALRLHNDLARIDPAPFRYIQGYVDARGTRHQGFIPGTYQVIYGSADVPVASAATLAESARSALRAIDSNAIRDRLSNALLDAGDGRLSRQARFMCTDVWPIMYQVATISMGDGHTAWLLTKPEVVDILAADAVVGSPLQRWWDVITSHYAAGEPVVSALDALAAGVAFIEAAAVWFRSRDVGNDRR